ncbi:LysE family translocator [Saccharothrix sp. 6-C]|uniref:Threonine/homoserine/homoserine lactone efflux protein n=1 Tax=Saccharothrix texasensis TaxID=103734 RepID=A0A3N1HE36_9PSEU|nr:MULTISPECIES: LysE family translocator [Saccharothrix]QQQ75147.1 LysE family translocator [Saccharothrix sp. 6-C]ROP40764.1 threonine/homoserine/homoserine lactone efflux protein [Saccharothrix texasensis]
MHLDFTQLPAFLIACAVVVLTPGVDAFLLLRTSMRSGTRAGLLALAGIHTAAFAQVGLVISGVGVVIARYPAVLTGLRWIGAAYLLYLAVTITRGLLRRSGGEVAEVATPRPFRQGFLTNITNPKMLLFSLAFLPQFIGTGDPTWQLGMLAAVFLGLAALWELTIVVAAARVAGSLRRPGVTTALDAVCAAVFLTMSVGLVL